MSAPSKWEIMMYSFHGVPRLELSERGEQLFDHVAKTEIFDQKDGSSRPIRQKLPERFGFHDHTNPDT